MTVLGACAINEESYSNEIAVSSDGATIVFGATDREGRLTVYDRKQRKKRPIGPKGYYGDLAMSADGKSIFCSFSSDRQIWHIGRLDISDGQINILTEGNDFSPYVLSDSKVLFWRSLGRSGDLFGGSNPADFQMFELDLDHLTAKQLTKGSFFEISAIAKHEGQAMFTEGSSLYKLDLASGTLTASKLPDDTFSLLCVTSDGTIIGNVVREDPYRVLPAKLKDNSVTILGGASQTRSAGYASQANTIFFGCILPQAIYSFDLSSGKFVRESVGAE